MYDPENNKLLQLDKDHIYIGFAVARGCNATFSDVVLNITDPKKDPPAQEEPPELVPLSTTIDCPTTWYNKKYPFAFTTNANGTISVKTTDGKVLIKGDKITAINNTSVDSLFKNYSIYEREKLLNRALARADISELSVRITDIACTPKLLQGTFPDFGLLKNVHLDHVNEACKYYTRGYNESYDIEEIKAFSNNDKDELEIISTRDDEDYDKTAPMKSTLFMAEKSFGDKSYHDTELSCELYRLA